MSQKPIVMEVIWSPLSLTRFEEILAYLNENFGQHAVNEFSYKLLSAVDTISQHPEIGKKMDRKVRAFVVVKQISIHYAFSTKLHILTLWDNRQMPLY